jgi:hypothetical protein
VLHELMQLGLSLADVEAQLADLARQIVKTAMTTTMNMLGDRMTIDCYFH